MAFTQQLAQLLKSGITLETALHSLEQQTQTYYLKAIIQNLRLHITHGYSFSHALQQFPKIFNATYCSMVHAAEQSGQLAIALENLAHYLEHIQGLKQRAQTAFIYPSITLSVALFVVIFLLHSIVPSIVGVFIDNGQTLPVITKILLAISAWCQHYGTLFLGILLAISISLWWSLKHNKKIRLSSHSILLKCPVLHHLLIHFQTTRYLQLLSMLLKNSIPLITAMNMANTAVSLLPMQTKLQHGTRDICEGHSLCDSLQKTHYFSPLALSFIRNGERSGQLADMLQQIASLQEKNFAHRLTLFLNFFEPALILLLGAIVLFIVLAILLPIFNMQTLIGR